jgi:uncharacterized SAM-binding protein YcdF (DUF218 family)
VSGAINRSRLAAFLHQLFKTGLALLATLILSCEGIQYYVASRSHPLPKHASHAVVVSLGLPGTNFALRAVQKWRVERALQACNAVRCDKILFSGGNRLGGPSEAAQMAIIAERLGFDRDRMILETRSTSTWGNVAYSSELVRGADAILLSSDILHASRARRYWLKLHPDAANTVVAQSDFEFFHKVWLSTPCTVVEIERAIRDAAGFGSGRQGVAA